jgi:hypothetical protein
MRACCPCTLRGPVQVPATLGAELTEVGLFDDEQAGIVRASSATRKQRDVTAVL